MSDAMKKLVDELESDEGELDSRPEHYDDDLPDEGADDSVAEDEFEDDETEDEGFAIEDEPEEEEEEEVPGQEEQEGDEESKDVPSGEGDYTVKQGECLSSIAAGRGLFWQTIWDDPANETLRKKRGDPNILLPGDRLHIREIREKTVGIAADKRHRFRKKGVPEKVTVFLYDGNEPVKDEPYEAEVDGVAKRHTGNTGSDGKIEFPIPPDARAATVTVGEGEDATVLDLDLGNLNPLAGISGAQSRLENLGYICETTGEADAQTRAAVLEFQEDHGLDPTGLLDDATRKKLEEEHRS